MKSKSILKLFAYSIFMVWLHEEFIIYIGLALHYRILDSCFFRLDIFTSFTIEKTVFQKIVFWFWCLWLLQELGQERAYISESLFTVIFLSFFLVRILNFHSFAFIKFHSFIEVLMIYDLKFVLLQWTFHPFIFKTKKIYTVLIWCRVLAFLVVSVHKNYLN